MIERFQSGHLIGALALAACSAESPAPENAQTRPPEPAAASEPPAPAPAVFSIYTSLADAECRLIERTADEMPFTRQRCPGVAGMTLEASESDLRESIGVERGGASAEGLMLPSLVGSGGFSAIGEKAEWRGPSGQPFKPRTLTIRYNVSENPDKPDAQTSYLVVARLASPACVVAVVPPGAGQSDRARAAADAATLPNCIERRG